MLAIFLFLGYKWVNYLIKKWRAVDIHKDVDEKKDLMDETIKASHKVDEEKTKAFEEAKEKLKEI